MGKKLRLVRPLEEETSCLSVYLHRPGRSCRLGRTGKRFSYEHGDLSSIPAAHGKYQLWHFMLAITQRGGGGRQILGDPWASSPDNLVSSWLVRDPVSKNEKTAS